MDVYHPPSGSEECGVLLVLLCFRVVCFSNFVVAPVSHLHEVGDSLNCGELRGREG